MHMSDALVSPAVAGVAGFLSIALTAVAVRRVKAESSESIVPLMGVMGAFIFAAQMINFAIPGTGSSGHIIGGVLLAALLGPWAALIVLMSVLIIQCLLFADGGLLALGCNILNMAVTSCLIAYPLLFRPLMGGKASSLRILLVSILACVAGLELGALGVTLETEASHITALPFHRFLWFMALIHLPIGIAEGLATAAVLCFIRRNKPELLWRFNGGQSEARPLHWGKAIGVLALIALVLAAGYTWLASSQPDGLEWSILQLTDNERYVGTSDYGQTFDGIVGSLVVVAVVWGISRLIYRRKAT